MATLVVGDRSGFPKRCFTFHYPGTRITYTICIAWLQYPSLFWRGPTPDPADSLPVEIHSVAPDVLQDLEVIDTIHWLSKRLTPDLAKTLEGPLSQGLNAIQKRLPSEITLN